MQLCNRPRQRRTQCRTWSGRTDRRSNSWFRQACLRIRRPRRLTYAAYEVGGADQTSWLHFNPSPADFFGTVPASLSGTIGIELVATNAMACQPPRRLA